MKSEIKKLLNKGELWDIVLSFPKTLWFNFRHLPLPLALRLPIWLHYGCKCFIKGKIEILDKPRFSMIRIGFSVDYAKNFNDMTYFRVEKDSQIVFDGTAHIGRGSKIVVYKNAMLDLGDDFSISASSTIKCFKHIKFGKNILFAWDCLVIDSDGHYIYDANNNLINPDKEIILGDNVWVGCGTTILKGAKIPNNCVVGANTTITGSNYDPNTIITGTPAMSRRRIKNWIK